MGGRLLFWSSSILVVFHFGCLPFLSSTILVQTFTPSHFDSKTCFDVFTFQSNAGEKRGVGRLPFWSSSILVVFHFCLQPFWSKLLLHHTLIPRPALMYSHFRAMLVKRGVRVSVPKVAWPGTPPPM